MLKNIYEITLLLNQKLIKKDLRIIHPNPSIDGINAPDKESESTAQTNVGKVEVFNQWGY
ncbi:hypothetical protein ACV56Z_12065 [Staphylococcus aureus]